MAIDWDAYRDSLGFLSGKRSPRESSGNAVLFAAHERLLRIRLGDWDDAKQKSLENLVILTLEIKAGLIRRPPPFAHDTESMDNYVGYGSISPSFARHALVYGREHYFEPTWWLRLPYQYAIDGNAKDKRAWLGRYPAMLKFFCDRSEGAYSSTALQDMAWAASVSFSGDGSSQDPWILNWHLCEAAEQSVVTRTYWRRLAHHWPGGLAQVFGEYLDDYDHPIVQACEALNLGRAKIA